MEAHELPAATARVSLRDMALEISADIDPLPLLAHIHPVDLSSLNEEQLASLLARSNQVLENETRLFADGQRINMTLTIPIDPSELRNLLSFSPEARHTHAKRIPIRWEAKDPLPSAQHLSLTLPAALGPVLISFVQPQSRYTAPGNTATFSVLEKPVNTASPPAPTRGRWAEGAVLLALVALGLNLAHTIRKQYITAR